MVEIGYFTPGPMVLPGPPLAPYRPATPVGALTPYLDAYTQPGDLVIDLFCKGPTFVHEAVQAGRRALGLNINRATLLAASLGLIAVERRAVEAAFTQLAETRKGSGTLQAHIEGLYRTTCAACGATTIADGFIWERDKGAPVEKRYHCMACGDADQAPVKALADEADRSAAASFKSRGLSYWLLLDRAAPGHASHRDRIASLLELYTPRNLSAVNDLLLKSDGLKLTLPVRLVLDTLLLDTLDWATSLRSPGSFNSRPRRLQRPARYVEENVWRLFERALKAWGVTTSRPVSHAPTLNDLLTSSEAEALASVHLAPLSSGQAARQLPPGCTALIVVDPPRPETVLWHLSALWCHWLWGVKAGAPLTPFLSHRWLDKDWLWRGLRGALKTVAPLLRPDGRLVCLFADENPVIMEALTLAAAAAGYELVGWGAQPPGETRLTWRIGKPRAGTHVPVEVDSLSRAVAEKAVDMSLNVLRMRGEPVAWPLLHAAIYAGLAQSGLLDHAAILPDDVIDTHTSLGMPMQPLSWLADTIRSALDGAPLRQVFPDRPKGIKGEAATPLWWLDATLEPEVSNPLSDRVELAVAETLRDLLAVTEADLQSRVCASFPGPQTPDARLTRLCLFSYGDEHAPGHWRLRSEDNAKARTAETDAVINDLASLGQRLGFEVALGVPAAGEWAVRWLDETGHVPYVFAVRTTAVLGDLLFNPPLLPLPDGRSETAGAFRSTVAWEEGKHVDLETTPCLTLPGGRAVLVDYKLRHDPRLRQQADRCGWQFLKFRHLRHMVQEVAVKQLDRYAFQAALGLDPIVEREEAQLSLW